MPAPIRVGPDACPGVFAVHDAADGALARIRLPGGVIGAAQLRTLADCAEDLADGAVHLTSRGNLQLRGLDRDDPGLIRRLSTAGLLPSPAHERVRNVLASPLSGIHGGLADVRGLAAALDAALCARPGLAALPGRFLFALDDGRGDVAAEAPDLCWRASDPTVGALLVAGADTGLRVPIGDAVDLLLAAAEAFLLVRGPGRGMGGPAWRTYEIPDAAARIAAVLSRPGAPAGPDLPDHDQRLGGANLGERGGRLPNDDHGGGGAERATVGRIGTGPALGVAPRLGELSAAGLRLLADLAPTVLVTPWRTLVLAEPAEEAATALAAAGLIVEPDDPALGVSACAGRPGCAKALADVRADARALLAAGALPRAVRIHLAGCERRCGAPHGPHTDVVATANGYRVDGTPVPVAVLGTTLGGAP
ncbi:precorrin-3B synthase [Pseudonocardia hispaniensis]|uniref:Precorrin-3B synthase n=1 Tax=Pseudonocardia hispaniensis TaxID=904933 RepID=A0ABW1J058_9PSEU